MVPRAIAVVQRLRRVGGRRARRVAEIVVRWTRVFGADGRGGGVVGIGVAVY